MFFQYLLIQPLDLLRTHLRSLQYRQEQGPSSFRLPRKLKSVHQVVRSLDGEVLVDQIVEHSYLIENGLIRKMDIKCE